MALCPGCSSGGPETTAGTGGGTSTTTMSGGGGSGGACGASEKSCGGACVAVDDPAYGCGLAGCTPCPAPDACHLAATCDAAAHQCASAPKADGAACDDGDACTQKDTCQAGACTGADPVVCTPDACNGATCNPTTGSCALPNATPCDDGDACTTKDTCQAGKCVGASPLPCTGLSSCVAGSCACPGTLGFPRPLAAEGWGLEQVAAADFDGDGRIDVAALRYGLVGIYLNQGNYTFAPEVAYALPQTDHRSLIAADLNADGKADLVAANGAGKVAVMFNQGDGTFGTAFSYTIPAGSVVATGSVAAADFDGDGVRDLAVTHDQGVAVLINVGSGAFQGAVNYAEPSPYAVAAGDVDADGKTDLAILTPSALHVRRNQGGGVFGSSASFAVKGTYLALADLSGDGKLDVAAVDDVNDQANVLLNAGDGTFGAAVSHAVGGFPRGVVVGDANGDGKPDILTANRDDGTISVLRNQGGGAFGAKSDFPVGDYPSAFTGGDMNGDGRIDLVIADALAGVAGVAVNFGNGSFAPAPFYAPGAFNLKSAALADLNGDGRLDVAAPGVDSTDALKLLVMMNQGGGKLAAPVLYPAGPGATFGAYGAAAGDLDGDGKIDLVLTASNAINVFRNQGNGTFAPFVAHATAGSPVTAAIGDLDGDGKPDVAAADDIKSVYVFLNQGNGNLGAPIVLDLPQPLGSSNGGIALADVDGDGKLDIAGSSSAGAYVIKNQGGGAFGAATLAFPGAQINHVAAGDLDGDGKPDLAGAGDGVYVAMNQGGGAFAAPVTFFPGESVCSIAAGDQNADGARDLTALLCSKGVAVLLNQGNGTFGGRRDYAADDNAQFIALGDLDGDLNTDIIVGGDSHLQALLNTCLP